jgi:hypothetical protein
MAMANGQCTENERLLNIFGEAVSELVMFQEQHFIALVNGDPDVDRFEVLIHVAGEKRQAAKYAYLNHIEEHGCERPAQNTLLELNTARAQRKAERPERRKLNDPAKNRGRRLIDLEA